MARSPCSGSRRPSLRPRSAPRGRPSAQPRRHRQAARPRSDHADIRFDHGHLRPLSGTFSTGWAAPTGRQPQDRPQHMRRKDDAKVRRLALCKNLAQTGAYRGIDHPARNDPRNVVTAKGSTRVPTKAGIRLARKNGTTGISRIMNSTDHSFSPQSRHQPRARAAARLDPPRHALAKPRPGRQKHRQRAKACRPHVVKGTRKQPEQEPAGQRGNRRARQRERHNPHIGRHEPQAGPDIMRVAERQQRLAVPRQRIEGKMVAQQDRPGEAAARISRMGSFLAKDDIGTASCIGGSTWLSQTYGARGHNASRPGAASRGLDLSSGFSAQL